MRRALRSPVPLVLVALCVLAAVAPAGVIARGAPGSQDDGGPCTGEINEAANGTTLISVQGTRFLDSGAEKTTAYVMAVNGSGGVEWVHNNSAEGRWWTYDVDPLANGNLLLVTTEAGSVVVTEYNPRTGEHEFVKEFEDAGDAHDVDYEEGELLVADKENNRIFAYNVSREEKTWVWNFSDHFERSHGGRHAGFTHLNDIDEIGEDRYLLSAKSFDQVLIVNRTTGEVEETIGRPGDHDAMYAQHNPEYQVSANGTPTILIADSENDRVIEYAKTDEGEWELRYVLKGGGLDEPRDVDWLPNGNLLVSDRIGHRVMEVTPTGEVVWEVYSPWQTYDAERVIYGDEPEAPNSIDLNVSGTFTLDGESVPTEDLEACAEYLETREGETAPIGTPTPGGVNGTATPPPVDERGDDIDGDDEGGLPMPGFGAGLALLALALLAAAGSASRRF